MTAFFLSVFQVEGTQGVITTIHMQGTAGQPQIYTYECLDFIQALWYGKNKRYSLSPFLFKCNNGVKRNKTFFAVEVNVINTNFTPNIVNKIKENVSKLNFFICSLASFPYFYICRHEAVWTWKYEPENSQGHLLGIWKVQNEYVQVKI